MAVLILLHSILHHNVDVDYSDPAVADQEMVKWLQDCGVGHTTIQRVSTVYKMCTHHSALG